MPNNIVLTFDYELFMGKDSGTLESSIINPTNLILSVLKQYNASAIFFVDTAYLAKIAVDYPSEFINISKNIFSLYEQGHSVQLHIHPQWIDAVRKKDRWQFNNYSNYRIHQSGEDEIRKMFSDGVNRLEGIISKYSGKAYRVEAFRAGGWSLQPFNKIKKSFLSNHIKYDFSVLPGFYKNNLPKHFIDYRRMKNYQSSWCFTTDPAVIEVQGEFFEIPATTFKSNLYLRALKKKYSSDKEVMGDGVGVGGEGKLKKLWYKLTNPYDFASLDYIQPEYLIRMLDRIKSNSELQFYTFVAHPKVLTPNSMESLKYLLEHYNTLSFSDIKSLVNQK